MIKLNEEELQALKVIVKGPPQLQPAFSPHIEERLLNLGLVRQTLGGPLKATDEGIFVAFPDAVAAAIAARNMAASANRKKKK